MKAKRIVQNWPRTCKAVVFLLILGTVLGAISRVLKFKYDDGILPSTISTSCLKIAAM